MSAWQFIEEKSAELTPELPTEVLSSIAEVSDMSSHVQSHSESSFIETQARLCSAQTVLIVGTRNVYSIPALLRGMNNVGQLTIVDSSPIQNRIARIIADNVNDGVDTKIRCVNASSNAFLPRLNAHDYDMVVVSSDVENHATILDDAHKLLRSGGVLIVTDAMALAAPHDKAGVPDPADRSATTTAMRALITRIFDDERYSTSLVAVGTGTIIAVSL